MNSYKRSVPLCTLEPGDNPRKDFGDLDAMAATIEATGGQPLNPIVVVPDGARYRIVDGERRYRAMRKIHKETDLVDVLVFSDLADAEQAVAMVATDDKQQLTETEKARGFQLMLLLGVEDNTIAKAVRRNVADVRKAKTVAAKAPEQATLDQMICAAEFEDAEDRLAVLEADPEKYPSCAASIRRRNEKRANVEGMRAVLEELGLPFFEEEPEGYISYLWATDADELRNLVGKHADEELAVWPTQWNESYWYVGHKYQAPEETPEERQQREHEERRRSATDELRKALLMEAATTDIMPHTQRAMGRLRAFGYDYARDELSKRLVKMLSKRADGDKDIQKCSERQTEYIVTSEASMYELVRFLDNPGGVWWWRWVTELLPAALDDDYVPTEEDLWLLGEAEHVRALNERNANEEDDE